MKVTQIVIPMSGRGKRFAEVGFRIPKPLIPIHNVPMIEWAIRSITPSTPHHFIFICLDSHLQSHHLETCLKKCAPGCSIIALDQVTEGAACTVLKACDYINNENPLMIANCDQYIDSNIDHYLSLTDLDGLIMTMKASDPKWSFVEVDQDHLVKRVVEKEPISDEATVGIYNFRKGADFVRSANAMIAQNERVNGEFYVAPVYNWLIREKKKIGIWNIAQHGGRMHGLGTPSDLNDFLSLNLHLQRN